MSLSSRALDSLRGHWAVSAIRQGDVERADEVAKCRLARQAVGERIDSHSEESAADSEVLDRVSLAYRVAATEGLDALAGEFTSDASKRDLVAAACHRAFGLLRVMPCPEPTLARLLHVFEVSATAYCGERSFDLRSWYRENAQSLRVPEVDGEPWDRRLLYRIFDCWIRLFRMRGWSDLHAVQHVVADLRKDQQEHESRLFDDANEHEKRPLALRLIALYHWAKATELLGGYITEGDPPGILSELDMHFERAAGAAGASRDVGHEMALRWLHASAKVMVRNSLWWTAGAISSKAIQFVRSVTHRDSQAMFELLPPQRAALLEQGLLDLAKAAVVVDLPTSGGKTLLAQLRILQALNQNESDKGWVAYVVPTKERAAHLTRRLRRDFDPIKIVVEQLTGSMAVDALEDELLQGTERKFDVLIATPEKLSLVIRNHKVTRPLALVVVDEAHSLDSDEHGLRLELFLATIKRDCPRASFLLLMSSVDNPEAVAVWLAGHPDSGQTISLGTSPWKPNERIVGLFRAESAPSTRAGWQVVYETLTTTPGAMPIHGVHRVAGPRPLQSVRRSDVIGSDGSQKDLNKQAAAIATVLSNRPAGHSTSVAITDRIHSAWAMARLATNELPLLEPVPEDVRLIQNFLRNEFGGEFELVEMLGHGVAVHHAGLSDEVRTLVGWLAESGSLRVVCATSTMAEGIDFPVSSVFLSSRSVYQDRNSKEIGVREFWKLAGRAGRIGHDSVGVVGLAEGKDRQAAIEFLSRRAGNLVSRLVAWLDELEEAGRLMDLSGLLRDDRWVEFRRNIAHLWAQKGDLNWVLAESEQLLRYTYGYTEFRKNEAHRAKAQALLDATRDYARSLAERPGNAKLADATGFSPEDVGVALGCLGALPTKLSASDWEPTSLFDGEGRLADLFGIMLELPQFQAGLEGVASTGETKSRLAGITLDWVNGLGLEEIASKHFSADGSRTHTDALAEACQAINRAVVNYGTWGIAALSQCSQLDFAELPETDRRNINALPAMIHHGVRTTEAVLMRMNMAPRSVAEGLGVMFQRDSQGDETHSVSAARTFLRDLDADGWQQACPTNSALSGAEYKRVWEILSGHDEG